MSNSAIQLPSPAVTPGDHLDTLRNKLINGQFDVWQRATPAAAPPVPFVGSIYHADRWFWGIDTDGGIFNGITGLGMLKTAFTEVETDVIEGQPQFYVQWEVNVAGSSGSAQSRLVQRIEDVRTLAGQRVTASFWAKGSGPGQIVFLLQQYFGLANPGNNNFPFYVNLTTSWKKYTITVDLPPLAPNTITAVDGKGSLRYKFFNLAEPSTGLGVLGFPVSYSGIVSLTNCQLEVGEIADPVFEKLPPETVVGLCQRYYQQSAPGFAIGSGFFPAPGPEVWESSGSTGERSILFPTEMRTWPTVSLFDWDTGTPNIVTEHTPPPIVPAGVGPVGVFVNFATQREFTYFYLATLNFGIYAMHWIADAEN